MFKCSADLNTIFLHMVSDVYYKLVVRVADSNLEIGAGSNCLPVI